MGYLGIWLGFELPREYRFSAFRWPFPVSTAPFSPLPMATARAARWPAGSGTSYDWLDRLVQVEKGANLGSTSVVRLY
ncbi:MAG: hypothetical protein KC910_37240, partial [Candidatus Eremiobacteraeota bacterium]|nr:hypothetical protein [Candidatus Eremiobacteraeota bacterium]